MKNNAKGYMKMVNKKKKIAEKRVIKEYVQE
jgi:hypothetical protein